MANAKPKPKTVAPKKGKGVAALAPRTKKADPEGHRGVFMPAKPAGVRVTEDTALTLSAVYACVRVISEDIAGLPWHVMEQRADGGSELRPEDPADWLLSVQANPEVPAFQFRETILAHALLWGNGFAEIERDGAGRPAWLWLLTPDRVCPERAADGRIVYAVSNRTGGATYLESEDVYHLRGLGFDGLVGYSVVQLAARSIGAGIALDQSTADLFGNDSTPGGVLKHPGKLSEPAAKRLSEDWEKRHAGPGKKRRVAVLEEGMDWVQTGLPPDDTKLIEQRQFTPADICRWFRVSPVKIQDLLRATFSNIEQLSINHVTDTLLPWVRRLEGEANVKCFGRTNRGRRFTRLNLKGLLRGDTAAQTEHVSKMLGQGVYDIDEARSYLDLNPIGPDGKKRFVPVNMQLLEKAGEEPAPEPQASGTIVPNGSPAVPNDPPAQEPAADELAGQTRTGADLGTIRAALRPVFEDAARRLLRAEAERAKSALKAGPDAVAAWLEKVGTDHQAYVRNHLRPATAALALAGGIAPDRMEAALGVVAEQHLAGLHARLTDAQATPDAPPVWEPLAGEMAGKYIDSLSLAVETAR